MAAARLQCHALDAVGEGPIHLHVRFRRVLSTIFLEAVGIEYVVHIRRQSSV